jgi:hypothetical protein
MQVGGAGLPSVLRKLNSRCLPVAGSAFVSLQSPGSMFEYCNELAVAYRVEADGAKTPICAYHIPVKEDERHPQLQEASDAKCSRE